MKTKFAMLLLAGLLVSCEQTGELTQDGLRNNSISQGAVLRFSGDFLPTSGIAVNGRAKIYQDGNQFQLLLADFAISEGPDLKVYLSKSGTPTEFINLGNLTSASVYGIPQGTDFTQYRYVLIHCQQYNHLFAVAELTEN